MELHESGENYLETIYMLSKRLPEVHAIDIVNDTGFSKPTISITMKNFREKGYVLTDENGHISLTEKGLDVARRIYERHVTIAKMFMDMGVSEETAYRDACRVEHYISDETFDCIKARFGGTNDMED